MYSGSLKRFVCMRRVLGSLILGGGAIVVLTGTDSVSAATLNLVATQDTWVSGTATDTTPHDNEGLPSIETSTNSARRMPWLQFDLSPLPANAAITSVRLEMFLVSASSTTEDDFFIDGFIHSDAAGTLTMDETTFSRSHYAANSFNTPYGNNEHDSILGNYAAGVLGDSVNMPILNQFYSSSLASAADLALLQGIANANGNLIFQIWAPNVNGSHSRTFEDREGTLTGNVLNAPRLVVEYNIVPEPSSLITITLGILGMFAAKRRTAGR